MLARFHLGEELGEQGSREQLTPQELQEQPLHWPLEQLQVLQVLSVRKTNTYVSFMRQAPRREGERKRWREEERERERVENGREWKGGRM